MACCTIPMNPQTKKRTPKTHSTLSVTAFLLTLFPFIFVIGFCLAVTDLKKKNFSVGHTCSILALALSIIQIFISYAIFFNDYLGNPYHANSFTTALTSFTSGRGGMQEKISTLPVALPGYTFDDAGLLVMINDYDLNYTDYDTANTALLPKEGWKYLMVEVTYVNTSAKYRDVDRDDFDCYTDYLYSMVDYDLDGDPIFRTSDTSPSLWPGASITFRIYYRIPEITETIDLEYQYVRNVGDSAPRKEYIRLQ